MENKCPVCNEGKVGCPICNEVGFIEDNYIPKGQHPDNYRKLCPECKGSRYLVCSQCKGLGKIKFE